MKNNYLVKRYTDIDVITPKQRSLNACNYTEFKCNIDICSKLMLMVDKEICNKNNGKIEEKENGEIIMEYINSNYNNYENLKFCVFDYTKKIIHYIPINGEVSGDLYEYVEKENEFLKQNFDHIL